MGVRILETDKKIELSDTFLRTYISESESMVIKNKNKVFRGTAKHLTDIKEREHQTKNGVRELYYEFKEGKEMPLDKFRLIATDERGKQMILDGLLEIIYLVSEGKIYNIEINPFNFIVEDVPNLGKVHVKGFYREDKGLREITDKWMEDVKKLIGYFLTSDTKFNEDNFNELRSVDFLSSMKGKIYDKYLSLIKCTTVEQMAKMWFDESYYKQIKNFPPIVSKYQKPRDITSVGISLLGEYQREESPEVVGDLQDEEDDDLYIEDDYIEEDDFLDYEEGFNETTTGKEEDNEYEPVFSKRKGKKINIKKWVVAIIIIGGVFLGWVGGKFVFSSASTDVMLSNHMYNGLLKSSMQKYQDASKHFDKLEKEEFEEMGEEEKISLYITYLKAGEYDKALKIDPDGDETVVSYLKKKDEIGKVQQIKSDSPAISYEKAVLNNDYEKVIELKDKVRDTEERQKDVIEALVMIGELESAIDYAETKKIEGVKGDISLYYKNYLDLENVSKEEEKKDKKKIKSMKD